VQGLRQKTPQRQFGRVAIVVLLTEQGVRFGEGPMNLFRRENSGERYPLGLQKGSADDLEVWAAMGALALAMTGLFVVGHKAALLDRFLEERLRKEGLMVLPSIGLGGTS
jgi:hypothetical protein